MARRDEAASLLKAGNTLSQIADLICISRSSVGQYLYVKVAEGEIRRCDILFSIDANTKGVIEKLMVETGSNDCRTVYTAAKQGRYHLDYGELEIYLNLRDAGILLGDMYGIICDIEITLHKMIRKVLVNTYGANEDGWWRQGIPIEIRKECAQMREEENRPAAECFCYTTFIHLRRIIDAQWSVFSHVLPKEIVKDKKNFLNNLGKVNNIRNCVMHPVKGVQITKDDFAFVNELYLLLQKKN